MDVSQRVTICDLRPPCSDCARSSCHSQQRLEEGGPLLGCFGRGDGVTATTLAHSNTFAPFISQVYLSIKILPYFVHFSINTIQLCKYGVRPERRYIVEVQSYVRFVGRFFDVSLQGMLFIRLYFKKIISINVMFLSERNWSCFSWMCNPA